MIEEKVPIIIFMAIDLALLVLYAAKLFVLSDFQLEKITLTKMDAQMVFFNKLIVAIYIPTTIYVYHTFHSLLAPFTTFCIAYYEYTQIDYHRKSLNYLTARQHIPKMRRNGVIKLSICLVFIIICIISILRR